MRPQRVHARSAVDDNDVNLAVEVVLGRGLSGLKVALIPRHVDRNIAAFDPAGLLKGLAERLDPVLAFRIAFGNGHHQSDPPRPVGRRLRQCGLRADNGHSAQRRRKLAPVQVGLHNETASGDPDVISNSQAI